jgi:hypothetical protein
VRYFIAILIFIGSIIAISYGLPYGVAGIAGIIVAIIMLWYLRNRGQGATNLNELKQFRIYLFFYFIILLGLSLYIIINSWEPTGETVTIENSTKPFDKSAVNAAKIAIPTKGTANLANITTETTKLQNSTTETIKVKNFLGYKNGTEYLLSENETSNPKGKQAYVVNFLHLQSKNKEVRLVSVSALFGLLGACISGIMSVVTRKIWATSKYGTSWRLVYVYFARPWIGISVALVTYISLRAGLLNMGNAADVKIISDFGIAAISALVGLMSDEMIVRLKDVFRAFFGITTLQGTQELLLSLPKNSIALNETIPISATLTELRSSQDLSAYFFVDDERIISLGKKEEKFNDSGVAISSLRGTQVGRTFISVMVRGGLDLYVSHEITVVDAGRPEGQGDAGRPEGQGDAGRPEGQGDAGRPERRSD